MSATKSYLYVLALVILFAGCVSLPSSLGGLEGSPQQAANVSASGVENITSLLERLSAAQGQRVDLQLLSSSPVSLIELKYSVNGQTVTFYTTPDYGSIIMPTGGNAISVAELEAIISQLEASAQQAAQPTQFPIIDTTGANVKGNVSAPVKIVEFSDFQCPFCGRFYQQTLPSIESNYIDAGKVAFYYMHFPLDSIHPMARPAARASECAAEQGLFWEMHDAIFNNQQSLSEEGLKSLAANIEGMNASSFNECFAEGKYGEKVENELQKGISYGVSGTPAFFIIIEKPLSEAQLSQLRSIASQYPQNVAVGQDANGNTVVFVSGALPYEIFDSILSAVG